MVQGLAPSGCSYLAGKPNSPLDAHSCTPNNVNALTLLSLASTQHLLAFSLSTMPLLAHLHEQSLHGFHSPCLILAKSAPSWRSTRNDGQLCLIPPGTAVSHMQPPSLMDTSDAAGYNNGSFYDPDSPSLAAWLERLSLAVRIQGLGGLACSRIPQTGLLASSPRGPSQPLI